MTTTLLATGTNQGRSDRDAPWAAVARDLPDVHCVRAAVVG
ncbi:MAG: hypothetical protein ACXV2J_00410 [Actinomycetes bacterium]